MKWFLFFFPAVVLLGVSLSSTSEELSSGPYGSGENPPVWKLTNFLVPGMSFSDSNERSYPPARVFVNEIISGLPLSRGSGFFIGPNLAVTNLHAILKFLLIPEMPMAGRQINHQLIPLANYLLNDQLIMRASSSFRFRLRFTKLERNGRSIPIKRIVRLSSALDLVLLETAIPVDYYLPVEKAPLDSAEDAWIYGYPGRSPTPAKVKTIRKTGDAVHFNGGNMGFLTDYHGSLFGGSGSPILDYQGKVRGMLYAGLSHFAVAITGQDIKNFIDGNMGVVCASGSLRKCIKEDREKLLQSAEEGDMFSQRRLGFLLYKAGSLREAQGWLERAARQNDPIAQYVMGTIDRKGRKLHWFSQAVEHEGFHPAKYELADYFLKIRQRKRAFRLLLESAEAGYKPSLKKLNKMGFKTPLTDSVSRVQFNLAAMRNRCYSFFR